LRTLGRAPAIGHFHDELLDRKFRFWNFYRYVIAYAWEKKPIQVICVVHGARDLAAFFSLHSPPDSPPDSPPAGTPEEPAAE